MNDTAILYAWQIGQITEDEMVKLQQLRALYFRMGICRTLTIGLR